MHTSGDDTDSEGDVYGMLDIDFKENDRERNQTNQDEGNRVATDSQHKDETVQENGKDQERKDYHINMHKEEEKLELKKTPIKYLGLMVDNSPIKTTEESESDDCADLPDLTTDTQPNR